MSVHDSEISENEQRMVAVFAAGGKGGENTNEQSLCTINDV